MASAYLHDDGIFDTARGNIGYLLLCFNGVAAALAVTGLSFLWWRSAESARARESSNRGSTQHLPAPVAVLPRWCGPFGGHTLVLETPKITEQLEGWAMEFGGDYELHIFGRRVVVVSAPAEIRRMLNLRPSKFHRGMTPAGWTFAAKCAGLYPSMFFEEDKEWGRSRQLISPSLIGHNIEAMLPFISKIGERMCTKLETQADGVEVVEMVDTFERYTHDIIALAAFGIDVNSTGATQDRPCPSFDAIENATSTFMDLTIKPFAIIGWKVLSSMLPWVRRAKEHSTRLSTVVQGAIDGVRRDAQQTAAKGDDDVAAGVPEKTLAGGSLLRKIIRTDRPADASERTLFSDQEALFQLKSLFVGGTETTALTLSWALYYLVKNPEAFARCRAEALQVAPTSDGMVSSREQLSQLVFCSAVFREAVRLKPPGAFLFLHNTEDYTMNTGVEFKKETSFSLLIRAVNNSEECFTRATEFVPERWIEAERDEALLGKGAGDGERSAVHDDKCFLSFGSGPRVCPGKEMAKAEASSAIAAICARFNISLAPGQADPPEERDSSTCGPKTVKLLYNRRNK